MSDMVKVTPKNIVDEARDMPWKVAIEPFRVAPRVYYVGNVWVGSFLVDTEEGLAIIDTTVMEDLYLLLESIRKLGFDLMNIKKIFLTHAHMDHDGAARALKEMTGAELYLSKEDEAALEAASARTPIPRKLATNRSPQKRSISVIPRFILPRYMCPAPGISPKSIASALFFITIDPSFPWRYYLELPADE